MKGFLDYLPGNSILHKSHPLAKLTVAIAICAAAFVSSSYIFLGSLILLNLLLGLIGDSNTSKSERKNRPGVFKRTKGLDLIECLMNYGMKFMTLYSRQGSRPSPWKRNSKKQNCYLGRPYK